MKKAMQAYLLKASLKIFPYTRISFPKFKFPIQIKHPYMWQSQSILGLLFSAFFLIKIQLFCDL